jgi:type VI secretion system protein ImpF
MARLDSKTRLSPPLMYVFRATHEARDSRQKMAIRDHTGERVLAGRRMRARQVITEPMLRQEVSRDLHALLNTIALESSVDMTDAPYVRKSILNFGIRDIAHRSIDETGVNDICEEIRAALVHFEPRLAAASLHVERDKGVAPAELKVRFVLRADLTCHPVHVAIEFVAEVIDDGKLVVNRL